MLLSERITNALQEEDLAIVKPVVRGGETSHHTGGAVESSCYVRVYCEKGENR